MNEKGYELKDETIIVHRELNELDFFVRDFLEILKKHSDYLVVSGFVSISTGRTRGTEDVDVLFSKLEEKEFEKLFNELSENGFWCYQGDSGKEVYDYIKNLNNVRFARKNQIFPNIELIPVDKTRKAKFFEFTHSQKIRIGDFEFKIPPIEFEILYKEIVLAGKKDTDDAKHLRTFFAEILRAEKFKEFKPIINQEKK